MFKGILVGLKNAYKNTAVNFNKVLKSQPNNYS